MSLAGYKPNRREVKLPDGGSFSLRAISLPDVAMLIDSHEYVINSLVQKVRDRRESFSEDAIPEIMSEVLMELIRESPILIANVIAVCADEPDQMGTASNLPVMVQIEALTTIGEMTFTDLASVKKFVADVMKLIRGLLPPETEALAAE